VITRSVVIDGQPIRVNVRPGRHSGTPLLLINGIGAPLELLQPFVDELPDDLEVVRFDVPGIGGSPLPSLPYRFTGLCRRIARLLSFLGYPSADVLGVSWGGAVAQHFAAFQPRHCRRLVLVSTATGALMVPGKPSVLIKMATPRRYTDAAYLRRIAPSLYGGSARTDPASIQEMLDAESQVGSSQGYLYQLMAGAGWTSLPFIRLIRQQTLVMAGDDDPIVPLANARLLNALIPHSRLHVFHGGHLGLVTEADSVAPVISRFLEEGKQCPTSTG